MRFGPFRLDINLQIERFAASVGHSNFIDTLWNHFRVAVRISSFLDTFSRCRLSFVSSTVYFDSVETSLGVTELLEQLSISDWEVPSPPLAIALEDQGTGEIEDPQLDG